MEFDEQLQLLKTYPIAALSAQTPPPLGRISIELLLACNIRCSYCYAGANRGKARLSLEEVCDLLTQAKALGAEQAYFLGGEPLLHPDLLLILEYSVKAGFAEVVVVTNATLLTPDICRRLYELGINVCVGLFTADPKLGRWMYPGSFARSLAGIDYLLGAGYGTQDRLVAITLTAMRENVHTILDQYEWMQSKGIAWGGFHPVIPTGCANLKMVPTRQELKQICIELARLRGMDPDEITPFVSIIGCRSGMLYITVDKRVKICPPAPFDIGNLHDQTMEDIWTNAPVLLALRSFKSISRSRCARCKRTCYGCRITALVETGDLLGEYTYCWQA